MKKFLLESLLSILLFLGTLICFAGIDWLGLFLPHLHFLETEMGRTYTEFYLYGRTLVTDEEIQDPLNKTLTALCEANGLDASTYCLHIVKDEEVNAFALPGKHIIVHTGLIQAGQTVEEVAGVIAHEMGHIEKGHILRTLISQLGSTAILLTLGDNPATETIGSMISTLSTNAYSREMEREADLAAVHFMTQAGLDAKHLANFMERMNESEWQQWYPEWASTHPDSDKRARDIRQACPKKLPREAAIEFTEDEWKAIQAHLAPPTDETSHRIEEKETVEEIVVVEE
ncbi:MAG: M48 family metallopeptidase [Bacteroides sp.]|nr:M48 family metallopeptidase [Bacteroides sp.]